MLDRSTVTGKTMVSARVWLAKMAEQREMWAYRWTDVAVVYDGHPQHTVSVTTHASCSKAS